MTRKPLAPAAPITKQIPNLRQRMRADGSWRIWWEPTPAARALSFQPVDLDATRLTWSERRAQDLNDELARARAAGRRSDNATPTGRTVLDLIENYRRSDDFRDLKPKTRDSYGKNLDTIAAKWGASLVVEFSKPVIFTWYETLKRKTPARAVALVRMLSILFARAERIGWRAEGSNPCARLNMRDTPSRDRLATWAELDRLIATADQMGLNAVGTACLMSALTGQRQTDVLKASLSEFEMLVLDGAQPVWVWTLTRSKRGNSGAIKLHDELAARLRPLLLRDSEDLIEDADTPLILCASTGREYDDNLFAHHFARVRAQAARRMPSLKTLQFRDLRRTFSTWATEGGIGDRLVGLAMGNRLASNARLSKTYIIATATATAAVVDAIQRPQGHSKKERKQ